MHYNAVTHTQKAIQNLRSQVKIFLRRNHDQKLPEINRKSKFMNFAEILNPLRNDTKTKQRNQNQMVLGRTTSKLGRITSLTEQMDPQKINVTIIKPKSIKNHKIFLPRFIKDNNKTIQSPVRKQSLQKIEVSLLQSTFLNRYTQKQFLSLNNSPKRRRSVQVQKNSNFTSRTGRPLKVVNESAPIINIQKICTNRQSCYSPWQKSQDNQLALQF